MGDLLSPINSSTVKSKIKATGHYNKKLINSNLKTNKKKNCHFLNLV